jgi:hypothetical protein
MLDANRMVYVSQSYDLVTLCGVYVEHRTITAQRLLHMFRYQPAGRLK